jgi:hypothetical protein
MQLNTKNLLMMLLFGVATVYFYYGIRSEGSITKTDTQKSTVSSEIVETDMGKRLKTYANSGTDWGMSPFGSGKPLEEVEEEKPQFVKPNTEWKTRTISGVTYVFGEGNPREVALPESEMKGCSWQEGGDYCTDNGAGYVDPLLEKLVYDVLSSPDWEPLLENCEKDFRIIDSFLQNSDPFMHRITYDTLISLGQYISLEEIFTINPQTGRKNIRKEGYDKLMSLYGYIQWSTDAENNGGLRFPLPGITKCVDTYGINIAHKLINIRWMPWRGSKDIPASE